MKTKLSVSGKIIFSVVLIIALTAVPAGSQVNTLWNAVYNGPGNTTDNAVAMAVDIVGNVYVTGWSMGAQADYVTIKYNSSGVQQWLKTYDAGVNQNDKAAAIAVDASGNVYVTGYSYSNAGGGDFYTIKYNTSGTELWAKRFDGGYNQSDQPTSIAVDAAGNVFVTGSITVTSGNTDIALVKYNSSGTFQWSKLFTGQAAGIDIPNSMVIDASSNVYITGRCYNGASYAFDFFTIKYNSSGTILWSSTVNAYNANDDEAFAIAVDNAGNVYVTGRSKMGSLNSTSDYMTIKYNSTGVIQWNKRYNGPAAGEDNAKSIAIDASGNIVVTGESYGSGTGFDIATVKYNSGGDVQWSARENGPSNSSDRGLSLAIDDSGSIYVTGYSVGSGSAEDFMTLKYNTAGTKLWEKRENGTGNSTDISSVIKLDNNGNVYVAGYMTGTTGEDFSTIKYSQPLGIISLSSEIPSSFELLQNYPNPFNPVTNIEFAIPKAGLVTLKVYDITGREAAGLINQHMGAGTYRFDFDAAKLSSGTYFYRLTAEGFTAVKKMMLIK